MRIRRVIEEYEARLESDTSGRGGRRASGRAEWKVFSDGEVELEVKIRDTDAEDGEEVEVAIDGKPVGGFVLRGGRGRLVRTTARGVAVPRVTAGDTVEIRHGGALVLRGRLVRD